MKRRLSKIVPVILLVLIIVGVFGHVAYAQNTGPGIFGISAIGEYVAQMVSNLVNLAVMAMGFVLALAGWLLNFSINLTLHIKDFVSSTPAIYTTWKAIRDISGIVIIFLLLVAAIQMILDIKGSSFGSLIKSIVVIGLLINFSFFFTGLGIDASNIVSVQIYNAIAPANSLNAGAATSNIFGGASGISYKGLDGGLSDIFMSSLKIQSFSASGVSAVSAAAASGGKAPASGYIIFFSGIVAVMIEFVAALSFVAAAAAFIFRFVILLLLLAFSPIWILGIGDIIPEVGKYSKQWKDQYMAMLTFMPVYLLLMYLALNVLTSNPNGLFGMVNGSGTVGNGMWYSNILVLGVNAFLVCFLLNMPLVVAIKMGGMAGKFMEKTHANASGVSKWLGGWVGTRTVGRAASYVNQATGETRIGNSLIGRGIRKTTVGALAKNKMGYTYSNEDRVKEQKDIDRKKKEIVRGNTLSHVLDEASKKQPHTLLDAENKPITPSSIISKMNGKEKLGVIGGALKAGDDAKTMEVLKYIRSDDFDAVKKSEDMTDEDKAKIGDLRKKALADAIKNKQTAAIKNMIDNMDGKDLLKLDDSVLREISVIENLKPSQLKTMAEEGLKDETKHFIGTRIALWQITRGTPHKARGFVDKNENKNEWVSGAETSGPELLFPKTPETPKSEPGPTIYDAFNRPIK